MGDDMNITVTISQSVHDEAERQKAAGYQPHYLQPKPKNPPKKR